MCEHLHNPDATTPVSTRVKWNQHARGKRHHLVQISVEESQEWVSFYANTNLRKPIYRPHDEWDLFMQHIFLDQHSL